MNDKATGIAVIGSGLWGSQHAEVFRTLRETRLVGVCDIDAGRAERFRETYGAEKACTDYRELLADPEIEAVSIATPDATHTPIILDALAAGKHVLSEKPLATTVEEAESVARAAAASDRVVMVDFHNRVNPAFAEAREHIANGGIGRCIHASARLSNTTFVPLEMLGWAAATSALWFLGSHAVDLLRFLLDDEVTRVYAVSSRGTLAARGVDTADVHLSILEFANGTKVTLENSWVLSPDNPQVFDLRVELVGDKGQLDLNPSHNGALRLLDGGGMKYRDLFGVVPAGEGRVGGFVRESIARFVDAVREGVPPLASVADGLAVTRVLTAIEASAASGLPVDLD